MSQTELPQQPAQVQVATRAVARQVLKSWWFWLGLVVVLWSGLFLLETATRYQARRYQAELSQTASNELARSITTISNSIRQQVTHGLTNQLQAGLSNFSNQIASALQEPQIQATIQSIVSQQATQILFGAISPALTDFQTRLAAAQARLDAATNRPAVKPATNFADNTVNTNRSNAAKESPKPQTPDAAASAIAFDTQSVTRQGSSYVVTAYFKRASAQPLGLLHFAVGAYNQLPARILAIDAGSAAQRDLDGSVDASGLEAMLSFTPANGADPAIKLLLSGPSVLQITSDALPSPVTITAMTSFPAAKPSAQ